MLPLCQSLEDAVDAIRSAPVEALRSAAWLEHELLPSVGLHEGATLPPHLEGSRGKGVQVWQWPNQLARYLAHLSGRDIDSYLELGISHGGTFIVTTEYLRRFNPSLTAVGIDIEIKPTVKAYLDLAPGLRIVECNTRSADAAAIIASRLWGLVFIDADHSEDGCWHDYQAVRDFARSIAFHDISNDLFQGVGAVWQRVTAVLPRRYTHEFVDQYADVLRQHNRIDYGIGLIELVDDNSTRRSPDSF